MVDGHWPSYWATRKPPPPTQRERFLAGDTDVRVMRHWFEDDYAYIEAMTRRSGDCWVWLRTNKKGYGRWPGGRNAHRVVYELMVGPIPPDRELHHTCDNMACVQVAHLVPVTPAEHARIHTRSGA